MATQKQKLVRQRSPAYPSIDLPTAVRRAVEFKEYAKKSAVTVSHVLERWGYKGESSNGMKVVAALGYYGLLHDTGTGERRKIQLTDRAWRILVDHEESDARAEAIRDAALSPKIFRDMWDEWGARLPPDAEMRSHLVFEKKFNERAVNGVIADYKSTLEFANLLDSDKISNTSQESSSDDMAASSSETQQNRIKVASVPSAKSIEIPIPSMPWPILTVSVPMKEEKWNQMIDMLNYMKPALVCSDDGQEGEED
ncbi:MAG: hypothetical protein ACR2KU_01740 [Gammaproteobacteria bacterium]